MNYYSLLILFLYKGIAAFTAPNTNCSTEGHCKCDLKGVGVIDLSGFISSDKNSYVEVTGIYRNEYRYYPCGVDVPWGSGDCGLTATICQHSFVTDYYTSIGDTDSYNIVEAVANGGDSYLVIEYSTGDEAKSSKISIFCAETGTKDELKFEDNISDKEFLFQFHSNKACPVPSPDSSSVANGAVLFIVLLTVLLIIAVLYILFGTLFTIFYKRNRGFDVIPNWNFWKDLPFLLKDGVLFTFSCIHAARVRIGGLESYNNLK